LLIGLHLAANTRSLVVVLVTQQKQIPKSLTPRAEDDCLDCQVDPTGSVAPRSADLAPTPWPAVKSPRGRQKTIDTAGYACRNPECQYHAITDAHVHALVGDGTHAARTGAFGGRDRIQDFVCQACGCKFSVRRDTALYRLRTPAQIVGTVLALLTEGSSLEALQRVLGIREATLRLWLTRARTPGPSLA
jgi:hypothetical protein